MKQIILDVYFGNQLVDNLAESDAFPKIFNLNTLIFLISFLFFILLLSVFIFIIMPKLSRTPKKYYERYLAVRQELEKIDQLYAKRKMPFAEYSFTQFHYAKEYEQIIDYLSGFPEYKSKLKNYKLITARSNTEPEKKLNDVEKKEQDTVNYFVRVLTPSAVYYKKAEIYQALLDEGYSKKISEKVVNKLDESGIEFGSKEQTQNRKAIELVDVLLEEKNKIKEASKSESPKETGSPLSVIETPKIQTEEPKSPTPKVIFNNPNDVKILDAPTIIDLKDLDKSKNTKQNFGEPVTYSKYDNYKFVAEKKTFFGSIFGALKPQKTPSVSEINDIFKNIEKKLK